MVKRLLALLLIAGLGSPAGLGADAADTDLANGVRQAQEGDFKAAVLILDGVARRLAGDARRTKDLARANIHLAVAYQGLGQEQTAKAKLLEARRLDPDMAITAREFPPRFLELVARTRAGARPSADPSPEPPGKRSKAVPILIGAAVLAGVGVAVAAGGGGGSGVTPGPSPQGGPLAFRLSWSTPDDLDLHVVEPSGFEISFLTPSSSTGGALSADVVCTAGTETIHWLGTAPRGTYTFWAANQPTCETARAVSFTLTVSQGNSVVLTRTGTIRPATLGERFSFVN